MNIELIGQIIGVCLVVINIIALIIFCIFALKYWLIVGKKKYDYIKQLRADGKDEVAAAIHEYCHIAPSIKELFKKDGDK